MEPIINFRTTVLNMFWTLLPRHFLFIVCKISCKIFFSLYITVKLDFDIDRKSAKFNWKTPQNISLRFHFIMNLLWTFHGTNNILIMVINFIKLDGIGHSCYLVLFLSSSAVPFVHCSNTEGILSKVSVCPRANKGTAWIRLPGRPGRCLCCPANMFFHQHCHDHAESSRWNCVSSHGPRYE